MRRGWFLRSASTAGSSKGTRAETKLPVIRLLRFNCLDWREKQREKERKGTEEGGGKSPPGICSFSSGPGIPEIQILSRTFRTPETLLIYGNSCAANISYSTYRHLSRATAYELSSNEGKTEKGDRSRKNAWPRGEL